MISALEKREEFSSKMKQKGPGISTSRINSE
jgi:hypothetical protein